MKRSVFAILFLLTCTNSFAQIGRIIQKASTLKPTTNGQSNDANGTAQKNTGPRKDSLGFQRRADYDAKDSIAITYRYLDSAKRNVLDSGVNDFDKYFTVPASWQYLGNNGAAAFPLIFQPTYMNPGWDAGFHAFDIYRYTLDETRIYKTTKPFSSLSYQLATGKEQMLKASHTQSPKQNINVGFDYRLINAPGLYISQKTNHNNYRVFGNYQGKRKRYNAYFVLVGNTIRAAQNGGIQSDSFLLNPNFKERFSVPVNMGNSERFNNNPFVTTVATGNTYKDFNFLLRQSYDLGKKDSVAINDSTTEYLFYPKLRLQYSLTSSSYKYFYRDVLPDSFVYKQWYNITIDNKDTFSRRETWKILNNDFSLIQFPDTKNTAQFFLAGITLQTIRGSLRTGEIVDNNIFLHGEYRNRTRNKKWDVLLKGEFYLNGFNSGDYSAEASLSRYLNRRFGNISLFFHNVNRTPSFIFDNRSSYNFGNSNNFNKENITLIGATATNSFITLGFKNYLLTNYTYFSDYYHTQQYSKPISVLQFSASKKIRVTRNWNYYIDATLQQTDGANPVKVPLLYTRSRLAFEGKLFKNLKLSTGIEARYYTPYKANAYSPIVGQFVQQDSVTIKNLPDIALFAHFRIRGFTGYLRAENLNSVSFKNGFGFYNNNFATTNYPMQGLIIRFGIQWWYVN